MTDVRFSSQTCEWETPQWLFDHLNSKYRFDLDACATAENTKCERFFTKEDDALAKNWGSVVWCNPPYGRDLDLWVKKAWEEAEHCVVVMLLPARTDRAWFHDYCLRGKVEFIRGRVKFGGSQYNAPFCSMIVEFDRRLGGGTNEHQNA